MSSMVPAETLHTTGDASNVSVSAVHVNSKVDGRSNVTVVPGDGTGGLPPTAPTNEAEEGKTLIDSVEQLTVVPTGASGLSARVSGQVEHGSFVAQGDSAIIAVTDVVSSVDDESEALPSPGAP